MMIVTYKIFTNTKKIINLLDSFPDWRCISPYQNIDYFKLSLSKNLFFSLIRMNRPFFIKFQINGCDTLILPLSKSLISSSFTMYGDRSGFGYLDFLYIKNVTESDIEVCLNKIKEDFGDSKFYINRIKCDSQSYNVLREVSLMKQSDKCVKVFLNESFECYFKGLSKSVRQNYRTANNRINKAGVKISFKRYNCENISSNVRHEMISLYLKRLKKYRNSVGFFDRIFFNFFDLGFLGIKKLNFADTFIIYIDGKIAAFMICLVNENELFVPRLAIDDLYSIYSPGLLLIINTIEILSKSNNKFRSIDFMQGEEDYKFQVGGVLHESYSFEIFKSI